MTTQKLIDDVLNDPTISHWLKSALSTGRRTKWHINHVKEF